MNKNFCEKLKIIFKILIDKDFQHNYANIGESLKFVPPGHFYSPIPSIEEIKKNEEKIFQNYPKNLLGIDLNEKEQLEFFEKFLKFYNEIPFTPQKNNKLRYFFENPAYSYCDGIFLYSLIRLLKPKKIIEIGSGYSTCLMLDVNELYFNNTIEIICIEPYPELLLSIIKPEDKKNIKIISTKLQEVDLNIFKKLEKNDILFIDSTHVSKIFSDVNKIFFEILPILHNEVYIHFHDIFYPFEYPKDWIYEGRAWNEAYILRAFLQYNTHFKIIIMNSFLYKFHKNFFEEKMPLCLKNPGGSIWLKKCKDNGGFYESNSC